MSTITTEQSRLASILEPPAPLTREQELRARIEPAGLFEAVPMTVRADWLLSDVARRIERFPAGFDPEWTITPKVAEELTKGLPPELWEGFESTLSRADAQWLRALRLEQLGIEQRLQAAGVRGTLTRLAVDMFDPAYVAAAAGAGLVTGGLGAGAAITGRAARLERFVQSGLLAAATDVPLVAFQAAENPLRDEYDVLWAGLGSMLLGGSFGLLHDRRAAGAIAKARKQLELTDVELSAMGAASHSELNPQMRAVVREQVLTDRGRHYFAKAIEETEQRRVIDDLIEHSGLDPERDAELIADLRAIPTETALQKLVPTPEGAPPRTGGGPRGSDEGPPPSPPANAGDAGEPMLPPKQLGDLDLSEITDSPAKWPNARIETVAHLGNSKSPTARRVAAMLLDDRLRKGDGSPTRQAASGWVANRLNGFKARFYRRFNPLFEEYARSRGIPVLRRAAERRKFEEAAGTIVRHPRGTFPETPISKAADLYRDLIAELKEIGDRHGVPGFNRFETSDTYLTRRWSPEKLDQNIVRYDRPGRANMQRFFANAMRKPLAEAGRHLTDEQLDMLAKVFMQTIRTLDDGAGVRHLTAFAGADADALEELLRRELGDSASSEQIDALVKALAGDPEKAGLLPFAKRRTPIDELHVEALYDEAGNHLGTLSMSDLLENRLPYLFETYARQVLAASAEAEVFRAIRPPDARPIRRFSAVTNRVRDELVAAGEAPGVIERTVRGLDFAHRAAMGRRLGSDEWWAHALRRVRTFNFIADGGSFVIPAVFELGRTIAEGGLTAALQTMPALRSIFSRARDGKLTNPELEALEHFLGLGTDRIANQLVTRSFDDETAHVAGSLIDRALERGSRLAADVSGLSWVTVFARRWTGLIVQQNLVNLAHTNRSPSVKRLAAMGLSPGDWDRIAGQIRRHAAPETGYLGRRILRDNWDQWKDIEAASKFAVAVNKTARRLIQDENVGDMHRFMSTDVAKTILQFRRFGVTSLANSAMHFADMHDTGAALALIYTTLGSAMAYVARSYAFSIGRADADEYRARMLTNDRIWRAAVSQSSWASLFPAAVDTVAPLLGADEPVFGFARNSGLAGGLILGNPTATRARALYESAQGLTASGLSDEREFGQEDARAIGMLLPFRNLIGVKNVIDAGVTRVEKRGE